MASRPAAASSPDRLLELGLELMRDVIQELRSLQFELSPPELYQEGLGPALAGLVSHAARRFGVDLSCVESGSVPRLDRDLAIVGEAGDGEEAVRLAKSLTPEIALVDKRKFRERETQVLRLLAEGMRTKEIAEMLGVSDKTAETYRARVMLKPGISNLPGPVKFAIRAGITTPQT
jgi:DNA-binding NarL/FixJ family response regulator